MKICYLLIGIFGFVVELGAQKISLEQYREQVLNYNQDIQKSQEAVAGALYALKQIRSRFFPALDASGNYSFQPEMVEFFPGTDLKRDNYGVEVRLIQNVYSGRYLQTQYKMSDLQQFITQLQSDHAITHVRYTADVIYWTAVANRDLFVLSEEYLFLIRELKSLIYKRFKEGAIARTDLLMVENRLKEAEIQQSTAFLNHKTALQALNVLRGCVPDLEVVLTDSIQQAIILPQHRMLSEVLKQRSDYQVAIQNIKLMELQTDLSRSNYFPQIIFGIKERFGTTQINIDGKAKWTTTFYTQINIPIFHWGALRQENRKNRTREIVRELERSQLKDQVNQELSQIWEQLTETARKLKIVYSSLAVAQDNLQLNTFSYNEGKLPILDVLSAQVSWLQAYTHVVMTNYQYRIALAQYNKICGE